MEELEKDDTQKLKTPDVITNSRVIIYLRKADTL